MNGNMISLIKFTLMKNKYHVFHFIEKFTTEHRVSEISGGHNQNTESKTTLRSSV